MAPPEVDGSPANRGKDQRMIWRATRPTPPRFQQRFLEDILSVSLTARLIAGKEQEAAGIGFEPGAPLMG